MGVWVRSLVRELTSCMVHSAAKRFFKKKKWQENREVGVGKLI